MLDLCYDEIDKNRTIRTLYSQEIIAMLCVKYGSYAYLYDFCTKRNKRTDDSAKGLKAWCAGLPEPYWTIKSRSFQREEWIDFFKALVRIIKIITSLLKMFYMNRFYQHALIIISCFQNIHLLCSRHLLI